MGNKEIKVNFIYEFHPNFLLTCKPSKKLIEVCLEFISQHGIDFNLVYFMINRTILNESDFDKPIINFVTAKNKGVLNIFVYDNDVDNSENRDLLNLNQNGVVIFSYRNELIEIKCSIKSKMVDVTKNFAKGIGTNVDALDFYYGNKKINSGKTFDQIINQIDLKKGKLQIKVEEKKEKEKKKNEYNINNNHNNQSENENFFQKNKIKILILSLIILIILIIFIILLFTVILKEKDSDEKKFK